MHGLFSLGSRRPRHTFIAFTISSSRGSRFPQRERVDKEISRFMLHACGIIKLEPTRNLTFGGSVHTLAWRHENLWLNTRCYRP